MARISSRCLLALALALAAAAPTARAATTLDVKTGEWETTMKSRTKGSVVPEDVLQKMKPEQRARLEAMMKEREARGAEGRTRRSCVTQQDLDRAFLEDPDDKECTRQVVVATSKKQQVVLTCTGEHPRRMEFEVEALSRGSVRGTSMISTGSGEVTADFNARWLSATCTKEDGHESGHPASTGTGASDGAE